MTVAYLVAALIGMAMGVSVLLWKRAGSPVDHERTHDPVPVTVAGTIATFVVSVATLAMLWWITARAWEAWQAARG